MEEDKLVLPEEHLRRLEAARKEQRRLEKALEEREKLKAEAWSEYNQRKAEGLYSARSIAQTRKYLKNKVTAGDMKPGDRYNNDGNVWEIDSQGEPVLLPPLEAEKHTIGPLGNGFKPVHHKHLKIDSRPISGDQENVVLRPGEVKTISHGDQVVTVHAPPRDWKRVEDMAATIMASLLSDPTNANVSDAFENTCKTLGIEEEDYLFERDWPRLVALRARQYAEALINEMDDYLCGEDVL